MLFCPVGNDNCWFHYEDINVIAGRFPYPQQVDDHNSTWYFTDVDSRQACVIACDTQSGCDSYCWIPPGVSGWTGCYGVSEHLTTHVAGNGMYSGKKVAC